MYCGKREGLHLSNIFKNSVFRIFFRFDGNTTTPLVLLERSKAFSARILNQIFKNFDQSRSSELHPLLFKIRYLIIKVGTFGCTPPFFSVFVKKFLKICQNLVKEFALSRKVFVSEASKLFC